MSPQARDATIQHFSASDRYRDMMQTTNAAQQ